MAGSNLVRSEIGRGIRTVRENRRFSPGELAERVGMSETRLREIERGAVLATAEELLFLAREFGVPASDFLGEMEAEDARALRELHRGEEVPEAGETRGEPVLSIETALSRGR